MLSGDGRYVAFSSDATNLVAGDTNGALDIFVHDRQTGSTHRVSVDSLGMEANGVSQNPTISGNGTLVAFRSTATNLVAGDTNGFADVFVRDRLAGTTVRVSVGPAGAQGNNGSSSPALSADGRFVAFDSPATNLVAGDTNANFDVFIHDRACGVTTRVSLDDGGVQGNGSSTGSDISADGRFVGFRSGATNLVAGDTNGVSDSFVRDRQLGRTARVSVDSSGTQGNGISYPTALSADASSVLFDSDATNLVAGDTNAFRDVFGHTERVLPRRSSPSCT